MTRSITETDVRHVAKLARLHVTDEQVGRFTRQLAHVLEYVAKMNELNVEGVEPLAHPLDLVNVLREDVERPGMALETALSNAPMRDDPFFAVPKVIGEGPGA